MIYFRVEISSKIYKLIVRKCPPLSASSYLHSISEVLIFIILIVRAWMASTFHMPHGRMSWRIIQEVIHLRKNE